MAIRRLERPSVATINSAQVVVDLSSAVKAGPARDARVSCLISNQELVENAVDAGATSIDVRLEECGTALIEVSDNGSGIEATDHQFICLRSHTSKLSSFSDLEEVTSLGFRGEALSSLCNLSELSLETATKDTQPKGVELNFDTAGRVVGQKTIARKHGTTIRARNLFHKIPVRQRDFIKNGRRELSKVIALVQTYALANPSVRFSLSNKIGKKTTPGIIRTQGKGNLLEVFGTLFGVKSAVELLPLDLSCDVTAEKSVLREDGLQHAVFSARITGLISKPEDGCGRPGLDRQFFFLNGRPFAPAKLQKGVNEIYKQFNLQQNPSVVWHLEIPPSTYDVNVSPDKRTIMFHSEANLIEAIKNALSDFLFQARSRFDRDATPPAPSTSDKFSATRSTSGDASAFNTSAAQPLEDFPDSGRPTKKQRLLTEEDDQAGTNIDSDKIAEREEIPRPLRSQTQEWVISDDDEEEEEAQEEPAPRVESANMLATSWASTLYKRDGKQNNAAKASAQPSKPAAPTVQLIQMKLPFQQDDDREESPALFLPSPSAEPEDEPEDGSDVEAMDARYPEPDLLPSKALMNVGRKPSSSKQALGTKVARTEDVCLDTSDSSLLSEIEPPEDLTTVWRAKVDMKAITSAWQTKATAAKMPTRTATSDVHGASLDETQREAEAVLSRTIKQDDFRSMRICGQFNLGFIIARRTRTQNDTTEADDLFIVDQHASDEKYNFETLTTSTRLESQRELMSVDSMARFSFSYAHSPRDLELSPVDELVAAEHADILRANGFDILVDEDEPAGKRVKLTGHPVSKQTVFGSKDLEEIIDLIKESPGAKMVRPSKVRHMLASRACRKSVMIGDSLKHGQMRNASHHCTFP